MKGNVVTWPAGFTWTTPPPEPGPTSGEIVIDEERLQHWIARGAQPIAPTVKALKVTWTPRSVLQVALEAPATRQTGDGIVLRVAEAVRQTIPRELPVFVRMQATTDEDEAWRGASAVDLAQETGVGTQRLELGSEQKGPSAPAIVEGLLAEAITCEMQLLVPAIEYRNGIHSVEPRQEAVDSPALIPVR